MTDRPLVRCIIARRLSNGGIGRSRIVPLTTALLALKSGAFYVVGPDPHDMAALALWQRNHEPFNRPRMP